MTEPSLAKEASPRKMSVEEQIKAKAKTQYEICNNECVHTASDCQKCQKKHLVSVDNVLAIVNADREALTKQFIALKESIPLEFNLKLDEVYKIGSKAEWREWLKKFEGLKL